MLRESFRDGLAAVRGAGWRAPALAVLSYAPLVGFGAIAGGNLLLVGYVLHVVVLLALVRVLGASRPEPLPPAPQVDEQGRRVMPPPRPGPATTVADRSPVTALRNAGRLFRSSVSLAGLFLLAQVGAAIVAVVLSGGKIGEYSTTAQAIAVLPVTALFVAFVTLSAQRVALEGDTRVLVAAAHSVRIARTNYGLLLLLTIAEPVIAVGILLGAGGEGVPGSRVVAVASVGLLLASVVKVVVTAVSNEVYLRGPRLDLPLDAAR